MKFCLKKNKKLHNLQNILHKYICFSALSTWTAVPALPAPLPRPWMSSPPSTSLPQPLLLFLRSPCRQQNSGPWSEFCCRLVYFPWSAFSSLLKSTAATAPLPLPLWFLWLLCPGPPLPSTFPPLLPLPLLATTLSFLFVFLLKS